MNEPSRPVITSISSSHVTYGDAFQIQSRHSTDINEVVLVKPVAITHHTDASQSLVQLQFCNTRAGVLDVSVPSNANLLTPGYYMLVIVDNCGVPSVAIFVHIGPLIKPKEKEFKEFKEVKEKDLKELKEIKEKEKLT